MRAMLPAICLALLTSFAQPASAVTREEIVRLAKSGVSDEVILALVDRDKTIFALTPEDLVALKRDGVSEGVLVAMLKSGRDEGEAAFAQQAAQSAADRVETAWLPPNVVVIGHGPDRPNSGHYERLSREPWFGYATYYPPIRRPLCVAQMAPAPANAGLAYVTECPLQPQKARVKLPR